MDGKLNSPRKVLPSRFPYLATFSICQSISQSVGESSTFLSPSLSVLSAALDEPDTNWGGARSRGYWHDYSNRTYSTYNNQASHVAVPAAAATHSFPVGSVVGIEQKSEAEQEQ